MSKGSSCCQPVPLYTECPFRGSYSLFSQLLTPVTSCSKWQTCSTVKQQARHMRYPYPTQFLSFLASGSHLDQFPKVFRRFLNVKFFNLESWSTNGTSEWPCLETENRWVLSCPYTVLVLEKQAVPQDSILPRCSWYQDLAFQACMWNAGILPACLCITCMQYSWRPEEGVGSPGSYRWLWATILLLGAHRIQPSFTWDSKKLNPHLVVRWYRMWESFQWTPFSVPKTN